MFENLCFSPIPINPRKESFSIESSSILIDKSRIRGFNFINSKKKQESFFIAVNQTKPKVVIKNIKNFDFKQDKQKIHQILLKSQNNSVLYDKELKKRIRSFNFRRKV